MPVHRHQCWCCAQALQCSTINPQDPATCYAPLLKRNAQRRGTTRAPLLYRCMLGPGAMLANTVAVMLPILHRSMKLGML
ncbi:hypothetical protein BER93_14935 [Xanthomonas fragariae]|nr:hypothetical protein BER92_14900 [Xanthomonas fragariae]AOD19171.1 hypothetical protein BER93_14935 [Xanthomonas fragariae]